MKLENQVVSLDLAKRLKELGVKQESLWYWHINDKAWLDHNTDKKLTRDEKVYSAFTVAELGEMLPPGLDSGRTFWNGEQKRFNCSWYDLGGDDTYAKAFKPVTEWVGYAQTEADARAKMLIYLLENGLIKLQVIGATYAAGNEAA